MSDPTCTTHHRACDCREAEVARLLRMVLAAHQYGAGPCGCGWCIAARRVLGDEATKETRP